jgi:hypothetical protein
MVSITRPRDLKDLAIGMRFKSPEKVLAREDIKRFAAEVDTQLSSR